MNPSFSLYLDLVRFVAALTVFLSHTASGPWTAGFLWQLRPLGSDAVVVFFVLSGYVIAHATAGRGTTARDYAAARLARLHSGAIPAIAITFAADAIGIALRPDLYTSFTDLKFDRAWQALNGVLFTHEVWWNDVQVGTNVPYWSLGYEAPYYLAYGVALFAPRRWGLAAAALILLVVGPNIAKLAPMWFFGVGIQAWTARRPLSPRAGLLTWAASLAVLAWVLLPTHTRVMLFDPMVDAPAYELDIGHYYLVAVAFAFNLLGFHAAAPLFGAVLGAVARPIRWLAHRTFALYLFHLPLIPLVVALDPWPATSWATRALVLLGVPLLIVPLAELSERRKDGWRRAYNRLLAP